jgi:hypothetical protein
MWSIWWSLVVVAVGLVLPLKVVVVVVDCSPMLAAHCSTF